MRGIKRTEGGCRSPCLQAGGGRRGEGEGSPELIGSLGFDAERW